MYKNLPLFATAIFGLFIACCAISCTSPAHLAYFQNLPDSASVRLPPITRTERVIEAGDELYISFRAKDNEAASYFNNGVTTANLTENKAAAAPAASSASAVYLVDKAGAIDFSGIGRQPVTGLTTSQLKQQLTKAVSPYLKDPLVDVRFATFKISVLGEVRNPGTHEMSMQRTTLLEALAAAGDLTINGQRYDIMLYRDYNGQRKISKIDLRNSAILNNPEIFQIQHNDVLYVKPRKESLVRENTSIVASMIGIGISVVTLGFVIANNN